ncbi:MAG: type II secretion system F family protein [Pirellulaceae bacterium]
MARIAWRRLSRLCHNVGTGLHAGLDIRRLWETQCQQALSSERPHLEQVRARIASGDAVAASCRSVDGFFPPLFCEMIEVGERTGRMELVFFRLAEHYDRLVLLRRNFLIGIAWPLFEFTAGVLAIGLLIYILGAIGAEWEGERIGVFGLSGARGAAIWFGLVGAAVAAIVSPLIAIQRGWLDPGPLYRVLIHVPVIGHGLRIFSMSRLTWALAMATDSDLAPDKAIELAVRSTQNGYYTERLDQMKLAVRRGGEMHDAFRATRIFPADFLDALETGEVSGRVSETLQVLAKDYEERANAWYRGLAVACGLTILVCVAGLIIYMVFHLFFNIYLKPINDTLNSMQ